MLLTVVKFDIDDDDDSFVGCNKLVDGNLADGILFVMLWENTGVGIAEFFTRCCCVCCCC